MPYIDTWWVDPPVDGPDAACDVPVWLEIAAKGPSGPQAPDTRVPVTYSIRNTGVTLVSLALKPVSNTPAVCTADGKSELLLWPSGTPPIGPIAGDRARISHSIKLIAPGTCELSTVVEVMGSGIPEIPPLKIDVVLVTLAFEMGALEATHDNNILIIKQPTQPPPGANTCYLLNGAIECRVTAIGQAVFNSPWVYDYAEFWMELSKDGGDWKQHGEITLASGHPEGQAAPSLNLGVGDYEIDFNGLSIDCSPPFAWCDAEGYDHTDNIRFYVRKAEETVAMRPLDDLVPKL